MVTPRTILFKAKQINDNKWVEGNYFYREWVNGNKKDLHFIAGETNEFHYYQYGIDPTTLSQFTGWKDRHGNRIFENDIVEIVSSGKRLEKYLIWWNREMSMMEAVSLDWIDFNGNDYYNGKNPQFHYDTFCLMLQDPWGDFRDIKVVGNLFDNYEIIKEALNG